MTGRLLPFIASAALLLSAVLSFSSPAHAQAMCADGTGPATIGKPYEPTAQGSYCDVRGGGARPHKGVDMMQSEGYLAPIPEGCNIMMNGDSPIWCQGQPNGVSGYGYYMRFACGRRMGPDGKEYKVEVRYAHIKGYDANLRKAIVSCSGCVGITPHVHYETLVEGRKVNPVCVWGEGISNNVSCPAGLSKPANLCDGGELKILHEQACFCPNFGCGGPGATTSMNYHEGVDPYSLSGNYGPPGGGSSCGAQNDSGGTPNNPGNVGGGGGGDEGPDGDGGQGDPNPNYQENEEGCYTCCCPCTQTIIDNHKRIRRHVDIFDRDDEQSEFEEHRNWMVYTFFQQHILPAMMMMTSQLTAVGVEQVRTIGNFLDAKHQLETQRLFQLLAARAHKDYHPSEGMCEVGTVARSLLASERRSDLAQMAIAQFALKRQLGSGDVITAEGGVSDMRSRLNTFINYFCDVKDNGNGLNYLCNNKSAPKDKQNVDIDYLRGLESKLTLEMDILDREGAESGEGGAFNFYEQYYRDNTIKHAALVPVSSHTFHRYVARSAQDSELARLSGSRWTAGMLAHRPQARVMLVATNPDIARNDVRGMVRGTNSVGGNVLENDSVDRNTTKVVRISHEYENGQVATLAVPEFRSILIEGDYGTLTIRDAGNFTYALDDFQNAKETEIFTYTIVVPDVGEIDANIIICFRRDACPSFDWGIDVGVGDDPVEGGDGDGDGDPTDGDEGGTGEGDSGTQGGGTEALSPDFRAALSMNASLYSHELAPTNPDTVYADGSGNFRLESVPWYLELRSMIAKRSVAVNSYAAIAGERVSGDSESAPFLKRLVVELGIPEEDVEQITGKNPSYFAQMEVLTKKIYENPTFYTELYDKPVNVRRKGVALRAIGLMQDRDLYHSMLRSEMLGSVLLETLLMDEQERLTDEINPTDTPTPPLLKGVTAP